MKLKGRLPVYKKLDDGSIKTTYKIDYINEYENYPRKMKKEFKLFMINFIYKSIGIKYR